MREEELKEGDLCDPRGGGGREGREVASYSLLQSWGVDWRIGFWKS